MQDDMSFDGPNLFIANQLHKKNLKLQEETNKQQSSQEIDLIRNKLAKYISK